MDLQKIRADWQKRGFSFGVWTDAPGQTWENYRHETDELFMVLEGEVELELGGVRKRPPPGMEILIPRNVIHSVRNAGTTQSRWLYGYAQGASSDGRM